MDTESKSFVEQFESLNNLSREQLKLLAARSLAWRAVEIAPWMDLGPNAWSDIEQLDLTAIRRTVERADEIGKAVRSYEEYKWLDGESALGDDRLFLRAHRRVGVALEAFRASRAGEVPGGAVLKLELVREEDLNRMNWPELRALIEGGFTAEQVSALAAEILNRINSGCGGALDFLKKLGVALKFDFYI